LRRQQRGPRDPRNRRCGRCLHAQPFHCSGCFHAPLFLLMDAVAPILGVLATLIFVIPESFLVLYLGFFAGFILYISASDLLPEAHSQHSSYKLIGLTTAGIIFIFIITRLI